MDATTVRDPGSPTLVIFAHPRCPCSAATIGELERLIPHIEGKVKTYVVFFKPKSQTNDWTQKTLWKKAQNIPGVQNILDEDGVEAARFGARTSGHAFLYDEKGSLVFQGGITPARGHMGDSVGRLAILAFFKNESMSVANVPVFGCALNNPERAIAGETP